MRKAVSIAAKFPRLGAIRGAVLDAQMAYNNPAFCRAIKKDPDALIAAGIAAIEAQYITLQHSKTALLATPVA